MVVPLLWAVFFVAGRVAARFAVKRLGTATARNLGTPVSVHATRELAAREAAKFAVREAKRVSKAEGRSSLIAKAAKKNAAEAKRAAENATRTAQQRDVTTGHRGARRITGATMGALEAADLTDFILGLDTTPKKKTGISGRDSLIGPAGTRSQNKRLQKGGTTTAKLKGKPKGKPKRRK